MRESAVTISPFRMRRDIGLVNVDALLLAISLHGFPVFGDFGLATSTS